MILNCAGPLLIINLYNEVKEESCVKTTPKIYVSTIVLEHSYTHRAALTCV